VNKARPLSEQRSQPQFLMTPRQHSEWARRARKLGRPDLAFHHEQLARVIERIGREQAATVESPPIAPA
jgi:hypothetical protein